jgi:putative tryptophan/tyrosine transport system substrate-binding protein
MNHKLLGLLFITLAGIFMCRFTQKTQGKTTYTIAILQTATHPALNATVKGFKEILQEKLGKEIQFVMYNAESSIAQAHALAQQLSIQKKYDLFFGVATPAAQALKAQVTEKPIIIAAVTDPKAVGLIEPNGNVCGVSDMIDVPGQIEFMLNLVPDAKTIGLLYTAGEPNSQILVDLMQQELKKKSLRPVLCALQSETDAQAAMELACRKCDVILAPTDNTVASTIALLASIAQTYQKPFIVSDETLLQPGVLAAHGVNYYEGGKQAGEIALQLLTNQKTPTEIGIVTITSENSSIKS